MSQQVSLGRISRRRALAHSAVGFGWLAASALLSRTSSADESAGFRIPARARRVIFMFMKGGPSQVDTFDPKPKLDADHGKELPFAKPRVQFAKTGTLLKSPWKFRQYGESGCPVSELFPHVARHVDDICFLNGVHGTNAAHGGAALKLHTGSDTFVRPGMGAWVNYGLGTENENLPGFITICPTLAHGGVNNWGAAFLPAEYQGVPMGVASRPASEAAVKYISNPRLSRQAQRRQIEMLRDLAGTRTTSTSEPLVEAQLKSFELAFRMQTELPDIQDLSGETAETLSLYGIGDPVTDDFGRQCLLARRFAEAGVRFIQVTHSDAKVQWDQHADLRAGHAEKASEVDKPIAGLLTDLKRRGLLDETLLLWGGEFGRTPVAEATDNGRDHNPEGFTMWMAGGGVRGGFRYGSTDDYGYYATENAMHIHDVHATLLALLGIDHERLTYRYAGRDFRLTDVAGKVHEALFA